MKETNKVWKTFGTFDSFEEADIKRNELLEVHELVKVKRFGRGGNSYRVKFWNPPAVKKVKKKRKKKNTHGDQ